jgi:hypothetical protein
MTIKFYSGNLVDQATLSASTENALFPLENLQDPRRTKVFRSTTNSDTVVLDFQETSDVDSVFIVSNPIDGFGISTLAIDLNATNSWGAPAYSDTVTWSTVHGLGYNEFAATQSYRFARLSLTSTLGYCELSKLFIGKKISLLNDRSINYGWSYVSKDNSRTQENRYGQRFSDVINRQRQFNISFSNINKDQLDQIFEIYDDKGLTKPFFVRIGCDEMISDKRRFSGMVYLNSIPQITNRFFNNYSLSMTLEEAM